jgi:hypothetical protein
MVLVSSCVTIFYCGRRGLCSLIVEAQGNGKSRFFEKEGEESLIVAKQTLHHVWRKF